MHPTTMLAQIDAGTREFITFLVDSGVATILAVAVFLLSVAALVQVVVSLRTASANGKLIEKLSVNTDVLKDQARNAEIRTQQQGELVKTLIVQTDLAKAAAEAARGAREDVDALTKQHESGVHDLTILVKTESEKTVEQVKTELSEMKVLLDAAIDTITTHDEKVIERITEPYAKLMERVVTIQRLLEHILPPEVRATIPVTLTGDLSLQAAVEPGVTPSIEKDKPE